MLSSAYDLMESSDGLRGGAETAPTPMHDISNEVISLCAIEWELCDASMHAPHLECKVWAWQPEIGPVGDSCAAGTLARRSRRAPKNRKSEQESRPSHVVVHRNRLFPVR